MADNDHRIADEAALRAIVGEPMEFVRAKVAQKLNGAMRTFIARSPLVFVGTVDAEGMPDLSPKGDPAGFVEVDDDGDLLIPERLGNRLTFGFVNLFDRPEIGLIFTVPGQLETLRVKGLATVHDDPAVLERMAVKGKPALLYTKVAVTECLFHCGKAFVRSELWKPESWPEERRSIAARGMGAKDAPNEDAVERTEQALAESYRDKLY